MNPTVQTMMNTERRRPGADAPEAALSELTSLARDLGIPASAPRDAAEVHALAGAIRELVRVKAYGLAHRSRVVGESAALRDAMEGRR